MSALGEPLKAEVELVAEKNEIGSLAARLASPDAFERAGLAYSNLLTSVKVSIEKRAGGEPYVRLTSISAGHRAFRRSAHRVDVVVRTDQPGIHRTARSAFRYRRAGKAESGRRRSARRTGIAGAQGGTGSSADC